MPITSSAKKALRASLRKKAQNDERRAAMHTATKAVRKGAGKNDKKAIADAYSAIDKALKRGILKKNTAARKKSQISRMAKGK